MTTADNAAVPGMWHLDGNLIEIVRLSDEQLFKAVRKMYAYCVGFRKIAVNLQLKEQHLIDKRSIEQQVDRYEGAILDTVTDNKEEVLFAFYNSSKFVELIYEVFQRNKQDNLKDIFSYNINDLDIKRRMYLLGLI